MKRLLLLVLVCVPLVTHADVGFAQKSVWLSHNPVVVGETVSIYAALSNDGVERLTSTAYFRDNGVRIGSLPISLESGEARIISISWTPSEGKHALAVELASSSVALAKGTEVVNVVVEKPSVFNALSISNGDAVAAAGFTDSSAIQTQLGNLSPALERFAKPAFETIDGWRKSGADFMDTQTASAKEKAQSYAQQKADLAGNTDPDTVSKNRWLTLSHVLYTILLYIYSVIQTVLAKAGLFFPIAAAVFFYVLWKLYKRFTRPKYSY